MHKKIGIVGIGMVGDPLRKYLELNGFTRGVDLFCYDADKMKGYEDDVSHAEIIFICVPTPARDDGGCDTGIVESVVAQYASPDRTFVIKSTVEPGTSGRLAQKYKTNILFNPEFLTEANAWDDMIHPDRQIIGHGAHNSDAVFHILSILPRPSIDLSAHAINTTEAEIGKYSANVFGSMKVTFANIIADVCDMIALSLQKEGVSEHRVDYEMVRRIVGGDKRIGDYWLVVNHGNYRGFGGYCFPKDTAAFTSVAKKAYQCLPENDPRRDISGKGIRFLEAMWEYNKALLASQGLTVSDVSSHDADLVKKLSDHT